MPVCHFFSCFWHLVQDSLCSRTVSILNLHHSPLLFSMFRMSLPSLPLTPSLQQASFSALILFCFFCFLFLFFFSPYPIPPNFATFLLQFSLPCFLHGFQSPYLLLSTPPYPLPGSMADLFSSPCGLPVCTWVSTHSPSCSCFPCPSYQHQNFFNVSSCIHILHGWKKQSPGILKLSPVVLVFFPLF